MPPVNLVSGDFRSAPRLTRADLLRHAEPPGLSGIALQIHRNHAFEFVGSLLPPFLWLSQLKPTICYSDYDDSLTFKKIEASAIQVISLDYERYGDRAHGPDFREWVSTRLECLRSKTDQPLIVGNWPSVAPAARYINQTLEDCSDRLPGVFIWDVSEISRQMGGEFFDERTQAAKGTRFSNAACIALARNLGLVRLPSALFPRIKALALDLDNTLYEGVLGEGGVEGVRITPAHAAIYEDLLRLRREGVFLSLLSKNDERDLIDLCRLRPDFLLKPEHFSAASVGWGSKPEGLANIAARLRIGIDSILAIDDNPGEIAQLHAAHPSVHALHSTEPAHTLFWLKHYPTLNGYRGNSATLVRVADLQAAQARELLRASTDEAGYMREMQIEILYALNSRAHLKRLAELSQKTNQFNTGLQRFSEVEVARRMETPRHFVISIAMRDKFSDSGIIGAIFARSEDDRVVVDEITISCRALGRNAESAMIALALAPLVKRYGFRETGFWFREGPRNLPARIWLAGFTAIRDTDVRTESLTWISWSAIPELQRLLRAPLSANWEHAAT